MAHLTTGQYLNCSGILYAPLLKIANRKGDWYQEQCRRRKVEMVGKAKRFMIFLAKTHGLFQQLYRPAYKYIEKMTPTGH